MFTDVFRGWCPMQHGLALQEAASNSSAFTKDSSPLPFSYLPFLLCPFDPSVFLIVPGLPDK